MDQSNDRERSQIISLLEAGVIIVDAQGRIADCNPAASRLLAAPAAPLGQPLALVDPQLATILRQPLQAGGLEITRPLPRIQTLEIQRYPLTDSGGRQALVLRDVTISKAREQEDRELRALAEALYDTALALNSTLALDDVLDRILTNVGHVLPNSSSNLMLIDEHGYARVVRAHGYTPADEQIIRGLSFVVAETCNLCAMIETHAPIAIPDTAKYAGWQHIEHVSARSYLGAPLCIDDRVMGFINLDSPTPEFYTDRQGQQLQAFASQAALAFSNARLYAAMKTAAHTDSLTGLATRRHWYTCATAACQHARATGSPLAVLMIDIDSFKCINDTHGHAMGDRVISRVAEEIQFTLREQDLVGRYGGEEYVGLLPATTLVEAAALAERMRQRVAAQPIQLAELTLPVTISIGVAEHDAPDITLDTLLTRADSALYAAKRGGRNQIRVAASFDETSQPLIPI